MEARSGDRAGESGTRLGRADEPTMSVRVAALMRDTIARTVHSSLVVNTPFPGRLARTHESEGLASARGMYRYATPTGKVPL